ncbi:MAG: TauD/TfdA family dioxygenase [Alphaproteobacteria bacterium]|nr:TauD/TfdA family dioxygenase [Alphaproteobacteria bacterium]
MTFSVHPVTDNFAAEIGDIDLRRPLSPDEVVALESAFNKYAALIFGDQHLSDEEQISFSRNFGPLENTIQAIRKDSRLRVRPEMADVSNLDASNNVMPANSTRRKFNDGNRLWHTDSSFKRLPAKCSLLYARTIPPTGGHTEFADMRAAYDALPAATKTRLEGLVAEHSIMTSRARIGFADFAPEEHEQMPPVPQVLVRTHAGSKRRTLYIASHAGRIYGMPDEEAQTLLAELMAHTTQRQFVYTHRWRPNELVMWDNRCTMHRGRPYDDLRYKRDVRRTTVSDVAPTCEQEGVFPDMAAAQ